MALTRPAGLSRDELNAVLDVIKVDARADLLKSAPEYADAIRQLPDEMFLAHSVDELLTRVRATTPRTPVDHEHHHRP